EIMYVGAPAHASTPENGKNPALAIAALIEAIPGFISPEINKGITLATVVQVDIGERAFGVSAHKGRLALTIRGEYEAEMDRLQENLENLAKAEAEKYGLEVSFAFCDVFPETKNHDESIDKIEAACKALGIPVSYKELPDRGSEDFGYFTKRVPGALFSIGNGEDYPAVHDSKFDFLDEEMKYATAIFLELAK
ncbi:MAG: M20/M25/M40 family metallo-hydrolase, partial [Firmicutes bacterium]|nr:M20/M25/M40 family metallo-hydrolase [Bacillota bacterium]